MRILVVGRDVACFEAVWQSGFDRDHEADCIGGCRYVGKQASISKALLADVNSSTN